MTQFYEVWDDTTANRLGEYETFAEARVVLSAIYNACGAEAVRNLAVLSYFCIGEAAPDDYQVETVLEGADFATEMSEQAARTR
jgi:hypothetical protein